MRQVLERWPTLASQVSLLGCLRPLRSPRDDLALLLASSILSVDGEIFVSETTAAALGAVRTLRFRSSLACGDRLISSEKTMWDANTYHILVHNWKASSLGVLMPDH